MRRKIVAGNWKMNTNLQEGVKLAKEIKELTGKSDRNNVKTIVCPPFIHLSEVLKQIDNEKVELGAQNCSNESKGAFTGEISAAMLQSLGVKYVIIGHSERRSYYGEKNDLLKQKVQQVLSNEMEAIYCCGEHLNERESGNHFNVVKEQIEDGIFDFSADEMKKIIIAYEPVWAIGTGVTASPEQAQEMHAYIRQLLVEKYGQETAENTTLLYGGSCKPSNAKELFSNPDVDGGLIGGASLKAEDFLGIITA